MSDGGGNSGADDFVEFNERSADTDTDTERTNGTGPLSRRRIQEEEVSTTERPTDEYTLRDAKMWAIYGNTFSPCERAVDKLPAGQYTIDASPERGIFFQQHETNLDNLLILPDSASEEVIAGIEHFWSREDQFRKFGFLWKRGVMLYGPPGSGKTSTVQIISKKIIDRDGLSFYITSPSLGAKGLELLRRIEPKRPIVVMLEDLDAIIERYGEPEILALLDGELQIDNVVFIATTNYPERLDKRLKNRPSRFDIIKKIGMPSPAARETYLLNKNPRLKNSPAELKMWVEKTKDFSIAHIKELIVSYEVLGTDFDVAVNRLQKMISCNLSSDDDKNGLGFL